MLAPTPPRCTTSSSTRNDSDTLCICSSRNLSLKRPGNVIRMSVAIDPATAIRIRRSPRRGGCQAAGQPDRDYSRALQHRSRRRSGWRVSMGSQVLVTDELHEYMVAHGMPLDEVAADLVAETQALGGVAEMLTTA